MFEQEVKNGMTWLDEIEPRWINRINTNTLQLRVCHRCVLGQLFGDYFNAAKEHGLTLTQTQQMGFFNPKFETDPEHPSFESINSREYWKDLTDTWLVMIEERQEQEEVIPEVPEKELVLAS